MRLLSEELNELARLFQKGDEEKFHWLVEPVLGKTRAERLAKLVWRLGKTAGVRELTDLVRRR